MERQRKNNYMVLDCSLLLSQFLVDTYAKIETVRLNFIRNDQSKLIVENDVHLKGAMCIGDGQVSEISKIVVLPSIIPEGPRYMDEKNQDVMT
jgi:hypothetical protein